jgi:hypothetical protein
LVRHGVLIIDINNTTILGGAYDNIMHKCADTITLSEDTRWTPPSESCRLSNQNSDLGAQSIAVPAVQTDMSTFCTKHNADHTDLAHVNNIGGPLAIAHSSSMIMEIPSDEPFSVYQDVTEQSFCGIEVNVKYPCHELRSLETNSITMTLNKLSSVATNSLRLCRISEVLLARKNLDFGDQIVRGFTSKLYRFKIIEISYNVYEFDVVVEFDDGQSIEAARVSSTLVKSFLAVTAKEIKETFADIHRLMLKLRSLQGFFVTRPVKKDEISKSNEVLYLDRKLDSEEVNSLVCKVLDNTTCPQW